MRNQEKIPIGYILTILAYFIWGALPIYWKLLKDVTPIEILFHRILWAFLFLSIISFIKYRSYLSGIIKDKSKWKLLLFSSLLIGVTWYVFIYAISINRILDASLGYYINPLVSVILGVIFLKEKLSRIQIIAVLFAVIGVGYMTINYNRLPILSLVLALSFGLYGLMKKILKVKPIPALLIETALLLPLFLGIFYFSLPNPRQISFLSISPKIDFLLIFSGVVTFTPLILFGKGANLIPLKSVGFIQYIAPTFMLLIGVLMYKEPFTQTHIISFGFIWTALVIYSWSVLKPGLT